MYRDAQSCMHYSNSPFDSCFVHVRTAPTRSNLFGLKGKWCLSIVSRIFSTSDMCSRRIALVPVTIVVARVWDSGQSNDPFRSGPGTTEEAASRPMFIVRCQLVDNIDPSGTFDCGRTRIFMGPTMISDVPS